MLATLTEARFSDPGWLFERKLDGERIVGFRRGAEVRLSFRKRQRLDGTYPELVDALSAQVAEDFVVDGEVVAFEDGRTSFARLQGRLGVTDAARARRSPIKVFYYLFDLMHLDGWDTTGLELRDRKTLLRQNLSFSDPLRLCAHRNTYGEAYLAEACRRGWEGVIAKRADAVYVGRRSAHWLKMKCSMAQELVIGGFTDPRGSRAGLGALLVGHYQDGRLRYAGKVGTGYSRDVLLDLRRRLDALEEDQPALADAESVRERGAHWVRPELVAQVAFTERTSGGKLRDPRYEGLRPDKAPFDVVRERPTGMPRG
jgi:bifunctional non-homologous end joining protein LigD